jgi:hypothetical protein
MMTPTGRTLAVASPDPVGSYTINYRGGEWDHYIYTVTLDLLESRKIPEHHPVFKPLAAGQSRSWRIKLRLLKNDDGILPLLSSMSQAPMIQMAKQSLEPGETAQLCVYGGAKIKEATVTDPAGRSRPAAIAKKQDGVCSLSFGPVPEYGTYLARITSEDGKIADASFYVRQKWSWYLQQARLQGLINTPRGYKNGNSCCECFYSLFGPVLAAKNMPDPAIDVKTKQILDKVLAALFVEKDGACYTPIYAERIQNDSAMISILVGYYEATHDVKYLEKAVLLANYIMKRQHPKGYYGGYGMSHYTSVIYSAKALMELADVERRLGREQQVWKERAARHDASVRKAIDELAARGNDIATEGGGTFEDGAVSCTATQLAAFALTMDDKKSRKKYLDAAVASLKSHSCLARLYDPDCRSNGATLRFWEVWGDIQAQGQAMLSPHGWSAWRIYAEYYLYLLTGDPKYLEMTINALGACTQLIEWPGGTFRYAYLPEPRVELQIRVPANDSPYGKLEKQTLGEAYLDTIGQWFGKTTRGDTYLDRVDWGNGVNVNSTCEHEIIKAMEEVALRNAFVCEKCDDSWLTWNCSLQVAPNGDLTITPAEQIVTSVHCNLSSGRTVNVVSLHGADIRKTCPAGMTWIKPVK